MPPGDDAIAGNFLVSHAEIGAAMGDIHVEFFERALIEQDFDPLARRQLSLAMLRVDTLLPAAQPRFSPATFQFVQHFLHASSPAH